MRSTSIRGEDIRLAVLALWCYGFHKVWTTESLAARSAKVKRAVGFLGYDRRMEYERFSIGLATTWDFSPRWWRNPIRWLRAKLRPRARPRARLVVTAVDHESGVLTLDSVE